jgi:hypothetical protein
MFLKSPDIERILTQKNAPGGAVPNLGVARNRVALQRVVSSARGAYNSAGRNAEAKRKIAYKFVNNYRNALENLMAKNKQQRANLKALLQRVKGLTVSPPRRASPPRRPGTVTRKLNAPARSGRRRSSGGNNLRKYATIQGARGAAYIGARARANSEMMKANMLALRKLGI